MFKAFFIDPFLPSNASLWLRWLLVTGGLMITSGCIVGPEHRTPSTPVPDSWHQELENGTFVGSNELQQWWDLFDDPTLSRLIASAEKDNLDLYAAYNRIAQARSQECVINSARRPTLSGTGALQNSKQSPNSINLPFPGISIPSVSIWSLGLDVGWEPDLFGRVERQLQSAEANTFSQIEAYRDILVTLYGDVAATYVEIRTLQQQLLIACQNVELQKQSLELAERRFEGGASPNVDVFQAQSTLASTESQIPELELQLNRALNRLSLLLGQYPGAMHCVFTEPGPIPEIPRYLPQVIPRDMVRQRPDIRQAERRLAGATADVGAAMAELLPSFRIGGSLGLSAREFSDLFDDDSFGYGLGPSFSWPIFQAGRIRCLIDQREAAVEEAVAVYEQTLLRASEEVENAIIGFTKNQTRAEALARTVSASEKSLQSVLQLYRGGKVDFQNVLDTQRTLFQAQNALAIAQGQIIVDLITFYRALGGGWDPHHHCPPRITRLACPDRCPPDAVEISCEPQSSRDQPGGENAIEKEKEEGKLPRSIGERIRDRSDSRSDQSAPAGDNNTDDQDPDWSDSNPFQNDDENDTDNHFDRTLKELEERLRQKPDPSPPQGIPDSDQLPRQGAGDLGIPKRLSEGAAASPEGTVPDVSFDRNPIQDPAAAIYGRPSR